MSDRSDFVSVLEDVAQQIEKLDLDSAKQLLVEKIDHSNINDKSKKKMRSVIDSKNNLFGLMKYVWDAILAYKGEKVVSEDLEAKVAGALLKVASMLENAKKACNCCPECGMPALDSQPPMNQTELNGMPNFDLQSLMEQIQQEMPEIGSDVPVFIIVQGMPQGDSSFLESSDMPDFDIQENKE